MTKHHAKCTCDRLRPLPDRVGLAVAIRRLGGPPLCRLLGRGWGLHGWPIEEVAFHFGLRPAELPTCIWEEHEAGMAGHLDDSGRRFAKVS